MGRAGNCSGEHGFAFRFPHDIGDTGRGISQLTELPLSRFDYGHLPSLRVREDDMLRGENAARRPGIAERKKRREMPSPPMLLKINQG